jgi:nucleoside 2-deoxyribosyltransferase
VSKRPTVYLAGPITGLAYSTVTDWRREFATVLEDAGAVGLDPMRGKDYLALMSAAIGSSYDAEGAWPLSTSKGIITRDRWDATRCDVLLVNVLGAERVSIGTVMEVAWADDRRKPIVLVMEPEGNPHDHPMIREAAGFIVSTLEDAMSVVGAILGLGR